MTRIQLDIRPGPDAPVRRSDARLTIAARLATAAADAVAAAPASALPTVSLPLRGDARKLLDHVESSGRHAPMALHELLDSLRQVAKMSVGELAAAVDATDADISQILAGDALPGTDFLDDLLDACRATTAGRTAAHSLLRPTTRPEETPTGLRHRADRHADAPTMSGQHRSRVLLSEDELRLRTPADLARVFQLSLDRAGLTAGQLAIKAKISRSQVYNLKKKDSTAVPRNPDQISAFLAACGVPPQQVGIVLKQWHRLDFLRRQGKTPELPAELPNRNPARDDINRTHLTPALPNSIGSGQTTAACPGDTFIPVQQLLPKETAASAETPEPAEDAVTHPTRNPRARRGLIGWFHDADDEQRVTRLPGSALIVGLTDVLVTEYGTKRLVQALLLILLVIAAVVVLLNLGTNSLVAHFGTLVTR